MTNALYLLKHDLLFGLSVDILLTALAHFSAVSENTIAENDFLNDPCELILFKHSINVDLSVYMYARTMVWHTVSMSCEMYTERTLEDFKDRN